MMKWILCSLLGAVCLVSVIYGCNEQVCASLVSKCQLIKSCDCDMSNKSNCTCCNNCQLCLAQLYSECCSCVEMCPHPDPEDSIFKTSAIEVMPDPIPELFNVLTEEEDYLQRWTTHKYPVYFESLYSKTTNTKDTDHDFSNRGPGLSHSLINCTVAFMSKCMSMGKCKQSCKSMGAAKYRWFHNEGCCQCIGDTCIDYGLNEPMCLLCREEEDDQNENLDSEKDNSANERNEQSKRISPSNDIKKEEKTIEQVTSGAD